MALGTTQGRWREANQPDVRRVRDLYHVTIGILGAGQVGGRVLSLLRGFEVELLVYDPTLSEDQVADLGARKVGLDQLMASADVISNHLPCIPATREKIGCHEFSCMKDEAIFVNTGRGATVDMDALVVELQSGRIRASLDVTDPEEPPSSESPLRSLPNVLLTPHIAGHLTNGCRRQGGYIAKQLDLFAKGAALDFEITSDSLAKRA